LRIAIASHIVLDRIKSIDGTITESVGGPSCYSGLTSRRFGLDVSLATKVGRDFSRDLYEMLQNNQIMLNDLQVVNAETTRFDIIVKGDSRELFLSIKCNPLRVEDIQSLNADCWLASPVIDEVPQEVLTEIKRIRGKKNFIMLDPQGYLRTVEDKGHVTLKQRLNLDLSGITAIKVDRQEMAALTGGLVGLAGMRALQLQGIEFVISTENRYFHLLHKNNHYWISMPEINTMDSTGTGDILCASFSCAYIKEKDPVWAICFGAGAVRAALETGQVGLAKIPTMSKIEQSASYFYNTIGFQHFS
jgi:sugar/nucleoside kinase (ribokinase family)